MAKKTTPTPNKIIDLFFDPETGLITIEDQQYQLRHAQSGTKLQFNNRGALNR